MGRWSPGGDPWSFGRPQVQRRTGDCTEISNAWAAGTGADGFRKGIGIMLLATAGKLESGKIIAIKPANLKVC